MWSKPESSVIAVIPAASFTDKVFAGLNEVLLPTADHQ